MKDSLSLRELQRLLSEIPRGMVVTYAEMARAIGKPRAVRAIGRLCGRNDQPDKFPCFKVVRSDGSIGGYSVEGGVLEKIRRLRGEGIEVKEGGIVDFEERRWEFSKSV